MEMTKGPSKQKVYRVWLEVQETEHQGACEGEIMERHEVAAFHTLEEALMYKYELSQKFSPKVTGESEVIKQMTAPESFAAGD